MGSVEQRNSQYQKLGVCFCGVFVCYLFFGFAQEKITRGDYNGEVFSYALSLVFVQCLFSLTFAKFMTTFVTKTKQDTTPQALYGACALCYTFAMVASNHALQYISYPAQVLGKACKPIPVMILGVVLANKRYSLTKYLCILMIVAGVALFMYKDGKSQGAGFELGTGEMLLLASLTLDGLTGVTQEKMRNGYFTNQHHMMYNVNKWSCGILSTVLISTGQGVEFINFCVRHPHVLWYLLAFCALSAIGQNFIFLTVVTFGPLTTSVITTTRKFFTILCSVIIFGNPMLQRQWVGTLLVFSGLTLDALYGKSKKEPVKEKIEE